VYGEHQYAVEPFAVPDPASMSAPERLMANEAVRLFVARVQAFKPRFALQADNAQAIIEICTQLDGLPLAIELAAARIRQFTPEALATHLGHADSNPLSMLSGGPRDLPARQQTLERAIAWSYDLLDATQQRLFRRMAVFVGGCTMDALLAVCQPTRSDGAVALVEDSLVRQDTPTKAALRWVMLEVIRAYAHAQLEQDNEREVVEQAHATYFLHDAEHAADEVVWLDRMEQDHDNLRAALRWSIIHDPAVTGLRLCTALWWFWETNGHWSEGRVWTEAMLAAAGDVPLRLRMEALKCIGDLAWKQGDLATAATLMTESLALSRSLNDQSVEAHMVMLLGKIALDAGEYGQAASLLRQSLALNQARGITTAGTLFHLSEVALAQEHYAEAQRLAEASLAASHSQDDAAFFTAPALRVLGEVALAQGHADHARTMLIQGVAISQNIRHRRVITYALASLAGAVGRGATITDVERAACIWGVVEGLLETVGFHFPTADQRRYDCYRATARARLGADAWASAWREGRAMVLEQAIAYALDNEKVEKHSPD
jgi:non-specific serine/threonine protein kinase